MNFVQINTILKAENFVLKPISVNDKRFIVELFADDEIKKFYIVPKEVNQDYSVLTDYWLNTMKNKTGTCWIISKPAKGFFSKDVHCGFVAFEFKDTLKKARISYAVHPKFRKQGIATLTSELVIKKLKDEGVITIEADIDSDNIYSEYVVKRLGFEVDRGKTLVDLEIIKEGGSPRLRFLWLKYLVENKSLIQEGTLSLDATIREIEPLLKEIIHEIETKGQQTKFLLRYFYLSGRKEFIQKNYEDARDLFGQCNISVGNDQFPDTHLYFYWLGRINEVENKLENAKSCYESALERFNNLPSDVTKNDIEVALKKLK